MKRIPISLMLLLCAMAAIAQNQVTFVLRNLPQKPSDTLFYLAGNFNGWSPANNAWRFTPGNTGTYQLKQTLAPGSYEYKATRGSWDKVECGKAGAPFANRTLHLLHDTTVFLDVADWQDLHAITRKHTASTNVHIISEHFDIPQLGKQRRIWIYLPPGYAESHKKYRVIYMHDGQNLFDEYTSGFGEWGVDEFMDSLKKGAAQSIVVGIDHGGDARIVEYDPYDSQYGKGLGDKYAAFLVETLKPYIDAHYRTLADARHTTVAGSSMGGLISMYAALKYPKVFGNAGIFSPAFWLAQPIYGFAKATTVKTGCFYFVCGDQESEKEVSDTGKMVDILKDEGLPPNNRPSLIIKGAKHNEAQWRGAFPAFYRWLAGRY